MIGNILVFFSIILSLTAYFSYYRINSGKVANDKTYRLARISYFLLTSAIAATSIYLLLLILNHDYSFTYVYSFTSNDLPSYLLISAFYAGQEGSFLLWLLIIAIIGIFLQRSTKGTDFEAPVMLLQTLIIIFILVILLFKSPFEKVWDTFPASELTPGVAPQDGRGLNPILENPWMVIHPPILFIGYAALAVPFLFAVAGLMKKKYEEWIVPAYNWMLFSAAILGLGIALGGVWAYQTLGWGGFWGWDPVENASLLPWILVIALIHTARVQITNGRLKKTNFLLAIFSFVFVLYATYITRSGVMSKMSVHSFDKPEGPVFYLLTAFLGIFILIGLINLLAKLKDLRSTYESMKPISREFALTIGSLLLTASFAIVFIGTSLPLFIPLIMSGGKESSVDISFFNNWNLPIVILALIINSFAYYLSWKTDIATSILKKSLLPAGIAVIITIIAVSLGINDWKLIILTFASGFTIAATIYQIITTTMNNPVHLGGYISHLGFSLIMIGIAFLATTSTTKVITLEEGGSAPVLGGTVTFKAMMPIETHRKTLEKYKANLVFNKDASGKGKAFAAFPIIFWSDYNGRESYYLEPAIVSTLDKDIYVSPKNLEQGFRMPTLPVIKSDSLLIPVDSTIMIKFVGFEMPKHDSMSTRSMNELRIGANVVIKYLKQYPLKEVQDTLFASIDPQSAEFQPEWKQLEGTNQKIGLIRIQASQSGKGMSVAVFGFSDKDEVNMKTGPQLTFEVSEKPWISLVWLGFIFAPCGFLVTMYIKRKKNKLV
jgi:cytochrome c-type biogenesis protein CcmF